MDKTRWMARWTGAVAIAAIVLAVVAPPVGAEPGTHSELTAVLGQGGGFVSDSPTARDPGQLFVEAEVNLHGGLPDTLYTVQRAVDFNPADVARGVCTIAPSLPFGWLTEGLLTTSPGGAGAVHIAGPRPPKSGTVFDLIFRVVSADHTQLLMSDCLTITVK